ncbi:MAG: hypothetical protein H6706_17930 [Myxococcales bacterium]|nr:hypothetical protein [Myxococcales bacterium]
MEVDRRRRRRYRLEGQRQGVCAIAGRTAPLVLPIVDVGALGILVRVPKALTPDWPGLGHLGPATLLFDGEVVVHVEVDVAWVGGERRPGARRLTAGLRFHAPAREGDALCAYLDALAAEVADEPELAHAGP